jgi:hypothetical protein
MTKSGSGPDPVGSLINWPSGSGSEIFTDPQHWVIGDQMFNADNYITLLLSYFFLDGRQRSRDVLSLFELGEINQ